MSRRTSPPKIIPWGPYRGRRITSLPENYLCELARRIHIDEKWREAAQNELVRRVMKTARQRQEIERSHERERDDEW